MVYTNEPHSAFTKHHGLVQSWCCMCLVKRVHAFGEGERGRQTVCLHACCVRLCWTMYQRLKDACKGVGAAATNSDIFTWNICFYLCSLTQFSYPIMCSFFSRSLWEGPGFKSIVILSLVQTVIRKRWLNSFVGASCCIVSQHRSFFQHLKRRFGAYTNQFSEIAYAQTKLAWSELLMHWAFAKLFMYVAGV